MDDDAGTATPPPNRTKEKKKPPKLPSKEVPPAYTFGPGREWAVREKMRILKQQKHRFRQEASARELDIEEALLAVADDYDYWVRNQSMY